MHYNWTINRAPGGKNQSLQIKQEQRANTAAETLAICAKLCHRGDGRNPIETTYVQRSDILVSTSGALRLLLRGYRKSAVTSRSFSCG
jgi:hypothetical protein